MGLYIRKVLYVFIFAEGCFIEGWVLIILFIELDE
jgi:hypothetical protein